MNSQFFAVRIQNTLPQAFLQSQKAWRVLVQDNDPSQTSKVAIGSLSATSAPHLILPARSPDLNPIENMFDTKKRRLPDQALSRNTVSESEAEFEVGVVATLHKVAREHSDKTTSSTSTKIREIVLRQGGRSSFTGDLPRKPSVGVFCCVDLLWHTFGGFFGRSVCHYPWQPVGGFRWSAGLQSPSFLAGHV